MGILKDYKSKENKINDQKETSIKDFYKKYDFDSILNNKAIEENEKYVNGRLCGPGLLNDFNNYISGIIEDYNSVINTEFGEILNIHINNDVRGDIDEFIKLSSQKSALEDELAEMEYNKAYIEPHTISEEIELLSINTRINAKEMELRECTKARITAYQKACESTLVSHELGDLYTRITKIQYLERKNDIQHELDLMIVRKKVLEKLLLSTSLIEGINLMIDKKIGLPGFSKKAMNFASLEIPLVKLVEE